MKPGFPELKPGFDSDIIDVRDNPLIRLRHLLPVFTSIQWRGRRDRVHVFATDVVDTIGSLPGML
jgi:hypothetical protein